MVSKIKNDIARHSKAPSFDHMTTEQVHQWVRKWDAHAKQRYWEGLAKGVVAGVAVGVMALWLALSLL